MSKAKKTEKDVIPNMELILILIFFASFIIWTVAKCYVKQDTYEKEATLNAPQAVKDSIANAAKVAALPKKPATTEKLKPKTRTVFKEVTSLYVVLDGLKLRKGPTRDSGFIKQFKLHDRVQFLEEVTTFRERINVGERIANDPWIRVRAQSGHEGWVYGAGVHYHKQKFQELEVDFEQ